MGFSIGSKQRVSKAAVLAPLQQQLARLDSMAADSSHGLRPHCYTEHKDRDRKAADSPSAASHGDAVRLRGGGGA